jgi:hypothetical protein
MSCEATRRDLLNAERPGRPPAALRPHLAGCPACRDWLRKLVELEARVPQLPVPRSGAAKARFLQQLREPPVVAESLRVVAPELPFIPPKERGLRKLAVALALAAAVVLFAVGLSLWPQNSGAPAQPVVQARVDPVALLRRRRDHSLELAQTPRQRVEVLHEFTDGLLLEARQPGDLPAAERLEQLATVYSESVTSLLQLAKDYTQAGPPEERQKLLQKLAGELARTESEFERLAAAAPEASSPPLRRIATAARQGDRGLRRLAVGENA